MVVKGEGERGKTTTLPVVKYGALKRSAVSQEEEEEEDEEVEEEEE